MEHTQTRGLVWFTQDLRLSDNPAIARAARECVAIAYVYCVEQEWWLPRHWQCRRIAAPRARFLREGLNDLAQQLSLRGAKLLETDGDTVSQIGSLIETLQINRLYCNLSGSVYQQQVLAALAKRFPELNIVACDGDTLFETSALPFNLDKLPASFTPFKKQVEGLDISLPNAAPEKLPAALHGRQHSFLLRATHSEAASPFKGGSREARDHLTWYFEGERAHHYKQTRNALDGWENSSKFSPWLAQGALSPREVLAALREYEVKRGANDSTYWIYFELLWREYFKWYARRHGKTLFRFRGLRKDPPLTTFYPGRFTAWCAGQTPYPLVNACMRQLNETGYMSNRGRQIAASCLVNELQVDWRYGAAYFEQMLIDYDVASNWGNWQYIAGVGADPRGGRHFNIEKQSEQYDPNGRFISRWKAQKAPSSIDFRDAADWPVMREEL